MPEPSTSQEASERTPLLSGETPEAQSDATTAATDLPEAEQGGATTAHPRYHHALLILTTLSIFYSFLTFGHIVGLKIAIHYSPPAFYVYGNFDDTTNALLVASIFAFLFSLVNIIGLRTRGTTSIPLWLNFIADGLLTFFAAGPAAGGLVDLLDSSPFSCDYYYYYRIDNPIGSGKCSDFKRKMRIVSIITLSFGIALALVHFLLFILRCIAAYRSRFIQQRQWAFPWRFPNGQLSVSFTIKFLREPERSEEQRIETVANAS